MTMTYTVRTGPLSRVIDEAFGTIDRLKSGTIERNEAATISGLLGRAVAATATDSKVRLSLAKILASEAKLVEENNNRRGAASGAALAHSAEPLDSTASITSEAQRTIEPAPPADPAAPLENCPEAA